jgi:peptide/nickel transport system permease protein
VRVGGAAAAQGSAGGCRSRGAQRTNGPLLLGGAIVLLLAACAVFAPLLAPHDPNYQHPDGLTPLGEPRAPGDFPFVLGTDQFGRDELSRLVFGARVAIFVAVVPNLLALAMAVAVGVAAGYKGGKTDLVLMRFTETVMTLPTFLLVLALIAIVGPDLFVVVLGIALITWTYPARVVHGEVVRIREGVFIEATRSLGASTAHTVVRHVLPHLGPLLIVYFTLNASVMVLTEAGLGFLGFGVQPPAATWGAMIGESQEYYLTSPWLAALPGACIALLVAGFYLLGEGLSRRVEGPVARVRL